MMVSGCAWWRARFFDGFICGNQSKYVTFVVSITIHLKINRLWNSKINRNPLCSISRNSLKGLIHSINPA